MLVGLVTAASCGSAVPGGSSSLAPSVASTGSSVRGSTSSPPGESDVTPSANTDLILEIVREGGLCAGDQVCREKITVSMHGKWVRTPGAERGSISRQDVDRLLHLIDDETTGPSTITTSAEISCPSAHDGQDLTYVFHSRSTWTVSNCNADLTQSSPLLELVGQIVAQIDESW